MMPDSLPHYTFSNGYQSRVLASIIRDPDFLRQYRDALESHYFENHDHQTIASLLLAFFDQWKERPGREVLVEELRAHARSSGWEARDVDRVIHEIDRLVALECTDAEIDSIKERAVQFGQHQAMKEAILECAETINRHDLSPGSVELGAMIPVMQKAVMRGQVCKSGVDVLEHMADLDKMLQDDEISDPRFRVPTGFRRLDKYLEGGLGAGELGMVMAASNVGKSMLLANFAATAVSQGKKVIYFTLELKPYEVAARILALMFKTTIAAVKNRDHLYSLSARKVSEQRKLAGPAATNRLQVVYFKPSQATSLSLRASVATLDVQQEWKPDLIIVDYIDEMRAIRADEKRFDDNSYAVYGGIAAELIEVGVDYQCPVWTAAQIQREGYGVDPELHHMGRSMQKVDKADVIVAICQNKDEKPLKKVRLRLRKNRRGVKTFPIVCDIDFTRAVFVEHLSGDNPDPDPVSVPDEAMERE
jgi:replicative DNA helicase